MRSRFVMLLGAILALAVIGAAPVAADRESGGTYLALGDSVAAGTQQPQPFTDNGYTNVLFGKLQQKYGFDEFVNLACPADDSNEIIDGDDGPEGGSVCYGENAPIPFGAPSQLAAAEGILAADDDVRLITLTVGANDIFLCGQSPTEECIAGVLGQWALNLGVNPVTLEPLGVGIIPRLRAAAPGVPIVAMNYYSPDLAFWLTTPEPFQDAYLEGVLGFAANGNGFIGAVYDALGVPVVDVAGAFKTFKTTGTVPKNVKEICKLTLMCEAEQGTYVLSDYDPGAEGPQTDIHPSNEGHRTIAKAFDQLIRKEQLLG